MTIQHRVGDLVVEEHADLLTAVRVGVYLGSTLCDHTISHTIYWFEHSKWSHGGPINDYSEMYMKNWVKVVQPFEDVIDDG